MGKSKRVLLGIAVAVGLLGMVPGTAFAAQPACGDTLMANTTLTANLDCSAYAADALSLGKNGIVLNLNGYTITGYAGNDSYSAVFDNHKNTTVTNGTIENAGTGVYLDYAVQATVSWLNINGEAVDNDDIGIYVKYGVGNKIKHVTINGPNYGMSFYGGASHVISNNDITADSYGVYTEYESFDTFKNNTAHAAEGFYDDYSGNQSYLYNKANGGTDGFYIDCDELGVVTLVGNTANDNSAFGFYTYYCYPDNSAGTAHNSLIQSNTANGNNQGFHDYYSINAVWTYNTANNNTDDGFNLDYPGGATISFNSANHNGDSGIELVDAYSSGYGGPDTVSWNTAKWNDYGIYSDYGVRSRGNVARHNTTEDCTNVRCV